MLPLSDAELLEEARSGCRDAMAQLYRRHHGPTLRYARTLVADRATAEDLVADVFVRLLTRFDRGSSPQHFRAYLVTAVRNRAVDHHRRTGRVRVVALPDQPGTPGADWRPLGTDAATAATDVAATVVERAALSTALSSLSPRHHEVLWGTIVEGRTLAQIARRLDITENAAAALAHRARRALRAAYQPMATSSGRVPQAEPVAAGTTVADVTGGMAGTGTLVSPGIFAAYLMVDLPRARRYARVLSDPARTTAVPSA